MSLLQISQVGNNIPITIFQIRERVTLENFAELEKITKDAYDSGMRSLVVDLSQIPALSSIGVRALVVVHKIVSAGNRNALKVACAQPLICDVLQISGLTQFIELYDTVDEAAASF